MSTAVAIKPSLTLKRRLNAPRARVYQAWTDPQKMMRWYAPAGAETLAAETDARVGGRFRVLMRTADGEEHDVSGVYREVVRDEKLVFTWQWRATPPFSPLSTSSCPTTPSATDIATAGAGRSTSSPTRSRERRQISRDFHI
jgi:uncharacterized protein YndB with AHSA1/START domain